MTWRNGRSSHQCPQRMIRHDRGYPQVFFSQSLPIPVNTVPIWGKVWVYHENARVYIWNPWFATVFTKPWVSSAKDTSQIMLLRDIKEHYIFFLVTAVTTSSKITRLQCTHDPKQRKAWIKDCERELWVKGRRWRPWKNTCSTEVDIAGILK